MRRPYPRADLWSELSDGFKNWNRLVAQTLSVAGLTLSELRALRVLSELGPCSMAVLAKEQGMTAPGMTVVVDKLEEAGFARRVRSDADRRTINVAITGRGGEALRRGLKVYNKFIERKTRDLSSQEADSFFAILNRILGATEVEHR